MKKLLFVVVAGLAIWVAPVPTQEREDRTLLSWDQMRAIINEASGDRALHTVQEMVPYPRVRPRAEYEGHFRESEVMARLAREAGFSNVEIESFAQGGALWNPIQAELWIVAPETRKLYDVYDVAVSICSGSETGDVTADMVDVGVGGRPEDYANVDVKGKIVLGSAGASQLQRLAVFERGAVGVVSYNPLHPYLDQDQIGSQSVSSNAPQGRKPGFGWSVSPRVGYELAARLGRGEKLTFRSIVKAETIPGRDGNGARGHPGRRQLDAGGGHVGTPLRGIPQAGRERRCVGLCRDTRDGARPDQARGRWQAAQAQT